MAHGLPGDSSSGYRIYLSDVLGKDKEEQCTLIKFVDEKLVDQSIPFREGLAFRETSTSYRNGLTGT